MKPLYRLIYALALLCASMATQAQISPEAVQSFRLANGMSLIVKPDKRAPTVVHMLWVRVGSMDETDGSSGLAHVLEHMLFKGTPSVGLGEYSRRVAAMGGRENAFTTRDATVYHQQLPKARLGDLMRLEADRFANNQWSDEEFAKEIKVVIEERRSRVDENPRAQLWEQLSATALLASPYRRPVIGWMNDIENLRPDDARAFYRRWYVPANAAAVVVGDVDAQEVLQLAQTHYGRIPAGTVPERKPQLEPEQKGQRRLLHKAVAEQAYVALDFKTPQLTQFDDSAQTQDALALTMLSAVLSGYSGARLERKLTQGPARVADSVGASAGLLGRGPQSFVLDGVPAPGKTPAQLEAALRAQVAQVAREGVSEAELTRVKTQWMAGEIYKKDAMFNQAQELGTFWLLGLPMDTSEQLLQRLSRITRAQVQDVAKKYFGDDRMSAGTLLPQTARTPALPTTPSKGSAASAKPQP
jgi:zinc protease